MSQPNRIPPKMDASGREAEVGALLSALETSRRLDVAPQVCFMWGPQGIGKTFVLSAFAREVRARGITLLSGSAVRGSLRPYGLFASVLPPALELLSDSGVPPRRVEELARRTMPVFGRAATRPEQADRSAEERRLDLLDAVAEIFAHLGKEHPPVVILDDVDAADGASLDLLRYLLAAAAGPATSPSAGAGGGRALWAIAFRDGGHLPAILKEVVARTPALTLPLDGLDRAGLRAFLSRPAMVDKILDTTGGVPERIEALLAAGAAGGVEDLLVRRVEELSDLPRKVLAILAAVGRPTDPDWLEAVLRGWTGEEIGRAVEELTSLRMAVLRVGSDGPRVFLARDTGARRILDTLPEEERAKLHGAIGSSLAEEGADPVEVSRHFLVADPSGAGFDWAVRAGEMLAERLAYGEAADAFSQALAVLEDPTCPGAIALYQRLSDLHSSLSEHPQALRWLGYLKRAHQRDPEKLREVNSRIAHACLAMGKARLAARICRGVLGFPLEGALPEAGVAVKCLDRSDVLAPVAFADMVEAIWILGHYDEVSTLAEAGIDALQIEEGAFARPAEIISLRNTLGKLRLHRGEYVEAKDQFSASAALAEARGLTREHARAVNNLGVVAQRQGRRREALENYRASLSLRQGIGDRSRDAFALQNIAALYHETGEFESALDHYHRALSAFARTRNTSQVSRTASNLANLYLFLGDLDRASSLCEHAGKAAAEVSDPYLRGYAAMVDGDINRARDLITEARRSYGEAIELFERIESPRYALETRLSLAALACDEGDLRTAREILEEASSALRDRQFPGIAPTFHLVSAEVELSASDTDAAARSLARARDLLLEAPDLEGPVRLYHLMGRLRQALGDDSGADANQARAQRLLDELLARVPAPFQETFLSLPRRRAVLEGVGGKEITPARVRRALALGPSEPTQRSSRQPIDPLRFGIVGRNAKLERILSLIDKVAGVSQPVLIRGPSGSGKELIADAIHRSSTRREGPYVKVNCAAMHEDLLFSELFGHEKGAFTGAHQLRKGRFELAEGGTLFLDEIGDISPKVQVALLRVMQQQEFERVGGTKTIKVDVRVLCATNRNLEEMISAGLFREDLYYRLKGIMLEVPGLAERIDDLPALVEHFLQTCGEERGEVCRSVSPQVMAAFSTYSWPGNIRELEQVVQSVSLFAEGERIDLHDLEQYPEILGLSASSPPKETATVSRVSNDETDPFDFFEMARRSGLSLKDLKRDVEERCIRRALEEAQGNIAEAARMLGMKRSRLSQIVNADDELKDLAGGR